MRAFQRVLLCLLCCLGFLPVTYGLSEKDQMLEAHPSVFLEQLAPDTQTLRRGEALRGLMEFYDIPLLPIAQRSGGTGRVYFKDISPSNELYPYVHTACVLEVLSCTDASQEFRPEDPIMLDGFFRLLYEFKYLDQPGLLQRKYHTAGKPWYHPYVTEAKTRRLIGLHRELGTLSRNEFFYVLYKEAVLISYGNIPSHYFVGMTLDPDEITVDRFHRMDELKTILKEYAAMKTYLEQTQRKTPTTAREYAQVVNALDRIAPYRSAFEYVYVEVDKNPLYFDPRFESIRHRFAELGIREVIGESYYDYSRDASYRKNNVSVSLEKFNNLVIPADGEFNYWLEIGKKGLSGIQNGWLIVGKREVWGFGGGLCGTATVIFQAAWFAGLDITERRAHTLFYRDLYPIADIGLDAAVFQYSPNLRFKNTTGSPILLHVVFNDRKDIARVYLLGQKPYRSISFSGPFREGRTYVRKRFIEFLDGTKREDVLRSTYGNM